MAGLVTYSSSPMQNSKGFCVPFQEISCFKSWRFHLGNKALLPLSRRAYSPSPYSFPSIPFFPLLFSSLSFLVYIPLFPSQVLVTPFRHTEELVPPKSDCCILNYFRYIRTLHVLLVHESRSAISGGFGRRGTRLRFCGGCIPSLGSRDVVKGQWMGRLVFDRSVRVVLSVSCTVSSGEMRVRVNKQSG